MYFKAMEKIGKSKKKNHTCEFTRNPDNSLDSLYFISECDAVRGRAVLNKRCLIHRAAKEKVQIHTVLVRAPPGF